MNLFSNVSKGFLTKVNSVLLLLVLFTIFIIPFFPMERHRILYSVCFTLIFLLSSLALSKYHPRIFNITLIVIIIEWLSEVLNMIILNNVSFLSNILFFDLIVVLFILQIVRAKTITPRVLMKSVTAYLLLGLSFAITIGLIAVADPNSYTFPHLKQPIVEGISYTSNYIYYGFVTLTTLGFGDIAPLTPAAKSFSIFTAITGQLYIAIIIATLVSKYLGQKKSN
jgi:voltage-gated potassium channel